MAEFTDLTLMCKDCGQDFTHTAGEQKFFHSKGFSQPMRCQPCRQHKKQQRERQQAGPKDERLA